MSAWIDKADEQIGALIPTLLHETAAFVTDWIVIATYVDSDGDSAIAFNCREGQNRTATLGLLNHALEVERAEIFWDEKPD